ncbi:hypothetical protein KM043_010879 [Ampulex compressa]|nr:hypothetical protein KM043_010879 [Ampulex compressa]
MACAPRIKCPCEDEKEEEDEEEKEEEEEEEEEERGEASSGERGAAAPVGVRKGERGRFLLPPSACVRVCGVWARANAVQPFRISIGELLRARAGSDEAAYSAIEELHFASISSSLPASCRRPPGGGDRRGERANLPPPNFPGQPVYPEKQLRAVIGRLRRGRNADDDEEDPNVLRHGASSPRRLSSRAINPLLPPARRAPLGNKVPPYAYPSVTTKFDRSSDSHERSL